MVLIVNPISRVDKRQSFRNNPKIPCHPIKSFDFHFWTGFFLNKHVLSVALCSGRWRISWHWDLVLQEILPQPSTLLWSRTNSGVAQTTEPPGHKPLVVNVIVVGPFEEEEEGIGVASDVVKVEGEGPDTPGYLRVRLGCRRSRIVGTSPLARSQWSPGTVHDESPISV